MVHIHATISPNLHKRLKVRAVNENKTLKQLLVELLEQVMADEKE